MRVDGNRIHLADFLADCKEEFAPRLPDAVSNVASALVSLANAGRSRDWVLSSRPDTAPAVASRHGRIPQPTPMLRWKCKRRANQCIIVCIEPVSELSMSRTTDRLVL
jgi:hypothetical protein